MDVVAETVPVLAPAAEPAGDVPIARLGHGPDGAAVLARRGGALVELHELERARFAVDGPRWQALAARVRAIGQLDAPGIRAVLALELEPPTVVVEGDAAPPLADSLGAIEPARALAIVESLARAVAAAHRIGLAHGRLDPWTVQVGAGDRARIELLGLATTAPADPRARACRAPELADEAARADAAGDVYALGAILELLVGARAELDPRVRELIADATAIDPVARPSAAMVAQRAAYARQPPGVGPITLDDDVPAPRPPRPAIGLALGRYELVRQLGVGGMGEVWAARDRTDDTEVAIKLLKPEVAADREYLRRFQREARVLARVGSPYIANVIDLNEDRGLHYLVLELVRGGSVGAALARLGTLPARLALGIVADACRALAEPHRLGVVHRDLKPDNLMFVRAGLELERAPLGQLVKLGDFGIARDQPTSGDTAAGATRDGTVLGTPEYMAPEQCEGRAATAASDVYALGCCLFALVAGRPPFPAVDHNYMAVILQQLREPPPALATVAPDAPPAVADVVARCLAKDPRARYADATELLAALEACDVAGTGLALATSHPTPPVHRAARIQTYRFAWDLVASPEALWPFVSNTEKMNRATGLAPVAFAIEQVASPPDATGARPAPSTTGRQRVAGLSLAWRELPYEWIEGSRHVVLRVFDRGLLRWYSAEVTLERTPGGGTRLVNTVRLEPRGVIARVMSRWEIGVRYRRRLDRVYRRLDRVLAAHAAPPAIDPIEPEVVLPARARARIAALVDALGRDGVEPAVADALGAYLGQAGDQDVARIRPLELAHRFELPEDAVVDACLRAVRQGALSMVWDVICPSCRIPSTVVDSLAQIEEHGRCKACNLGYRVDFSRAIELAFRAAPEIRDVETRTYCIGGPAHFPHVVAQLRLAGGERYALALALAPGFYQLRSPQLAREYDLRVVATGGVRRLDLVLGDRATLPALTAGDQLLALANPDPRELLIRVERAGDRRFALTAARAMATATFRALFPDQQLAPGRLMAVAQATLVVAALDEASALFRELGDHAAFPVAARFFEVVGNLAREHGGSLLKTFGGLAVAAFQRSGPAVDAARAIQATLDATPATAGRRARVAVHAGPVMALSHDGRLDYFGQHVEHALRLAAEAAPATVALTAAVCQDAAVADRLAALPAAEQRGMTPAAGVAWVLHLRAPRGARSEPALSTASTVVLP